MDKLNQYEASILYFLHQYAEEMYGQDPSGIETQIIADKENRHYLLMRTGWDGDRYIHYVPIHIDIKNDKVWVVINNTEEMVGDELVKQGIHRKDIVLAFHPKELREYTEFAID